MGGGGGDDHDSEMVVSCDSSAASGEHAPIGYKIGGLAALLVCSTLGYILPFYLGRVSRLAIFLFRTFSAGVVLAVAVVHIIPDAAEALTNACLGLSTEFPWTFVFVTHAIILTFALEKTLEKVIASSVEGGRSSQRTVEDGAEAPIVEVEDEKAVALRKVRSAAFTLEAGVVFHSIFIGVSFGSTREADTILSLMIAILFHQAFEGVALGILFCKAQVGFKKALVCGLLFVITTPIGIGIGLAIYNSFNSNSKAYLAIEGTFNSLSGGILLYNGLVDLLIPAFDEKDPDGPSSTFITTLGFASVLVGSGLMSMIALWA